MTTAQIVANNPAPHCMTHEESRARRFSRYVDAFNVARGVGIMATVRGPDSRLVVTVDWKGSRYYYA